MKDAYSILTNLDAQKYSILYRFQGGKSYPSFNIVGDSCKVNDNYYTYISKSINHHKYFVSKRLKQIVGKMVFDEKGMVLSKNNLSDIDFYKNIKREILLSDKVKGLESLRFLVDPSFIKLLEDNFEYNDNKSKGSRNIERVDRRVYGGGYGLGDEWLRLFNILTVLYAKKAITRDNIIYMLNCIKCGTKTKLESVSFLNDEIDNVIINELLYYSLTKYKIVEELESILDKGLYKSNSELGKKPTETIKNIVNNYGNLRDNTLIQLEKVKKT